MTDELIKKLEDVGFTRWTKAGHDRLYVNAKVLGLEVDYYKTGNVKWAAFRGVEISNSEGRRMLNDKTYVDVKTGRVFSTCPKLAEAAEELIKEAEA